MIDQAENLRKMVEEKNGETEKSEKKTRIITVSSGKGGVGKTNLSINLAIAYSMLGKNVVVLDADLGLANVNVILGIIPEYNLFNLIKKQKKMKDILINTGYGINIIAGASGFSKIANLDEEERHSFIDEMKELSFADIIIIDTSAGVSNNVLAFIAAADDAVIITTPEPTAITDAYGIIKIISTEFDNPDMSIKLIVNRVKSVTEGKKVAQRVVNIAGQFLNIKVDYLGYVYDDSVVQNAVIRQKPFVVTEPKSKAAVCVKHIVSRLEKIEYKEGGGLGSFLKKMFRNTE